MELDGQVAIITGAGRGIALDGKFLDETRLLHRYGPV
jgi:hypothetical protein